jgi:hypothetical protein
VRRAALSPLRLPSRAGAGGVAGGPRDAPEIDWVT